MGEAGNAHPPIGRVRLSRAPLAAAAALMAGGILAGRYVPLPTGAYVLTGAVAAVCAVALLMRRHLHAAAAGCVAAAIFLLSAGWCGLAWRRVDADHVARCTSRAPIPATIRGRVASTPQVVDSIDPPYPRPPRTVFALETEAIRTHGAGGTIWTDVSGLVRVSVAHGPPGAARAAEPDVRGGQRVELVGWLGRYAPPDNPGQPDAAAAARLRHTAAWMSVPAPQGVRPLPGPETAAHRRACWRVRAGLRNHLASLGDADDGRLVNALITGERHPALKAVNQTMVRAGVAHLLSISGMHLGIFLAFVYGLCRLLTLSPRRSATLVLVVLTAYMLVAEPRPPLLRSAIMASAICLAVLTHRRYAALNALAAAAIILLVGDPLRLFTPGFQLSFAIVTGLILLRRPAVELLFGRFLRRRGLTVFRDDQRVRRWAYHRAADAGMQFVAMSLVAYLVAAPLVAYHFGLFSPYAPLLSILLLPLVAAVLAPGYLSAALAWPMPNLSRAIGGLSASAAEALAWTVRQLERLPALAIELRPIDAWVVVAFFAAIALTVWRRAIPFGRTAACAAALAFAGGLTAGQLPARPPAGAELHLLAVGSGQCALLRTPSGRTVLLDAGTMSDMNIHQGVLRPFLDNRRFPAPDAAFISHANVDHYGAIAAVAEAGSLRRVYLNPFFGRPLADASPPPEAELLSRLRAGGIEIVRLAEGDRVELDDRTTIDVLWPPERPSQPLTVNDTSLVLRVTCDGLSALVPGDLDETGQAALAARPDRVRSEVLVLPHHGGWEKTLPAFVDAVAPSVILVSARRELRPPISSGRAGETFYGRLRRDYRFYSTARNGWIGVRWDGSGARVETMHPYGG